MKPNEPTVTTELNAQVANSGPTTSETYTWYRNTMVVSSLTGPVVPTSMLKKNDIWRVGVVQTNTVTGASTPPGFAQRTISNR